MGFLRFFLALSVVLYHLDILYKLRILNYVSLPGPVAVKAFFIISGFYMALILNEKYIAKNDSYFLYISNRFLRIFPLYWVVLLSTYLLDILTGSFSTLLHRSSFFGVIGSNIFSLVTYLLANITLFISPNIYIFDRHFSDGLLAIGTAWTLALEVTFYLIAPFLVRGSLKKLVVLLGISIILKIVLTHYPILYPVDRVDYLFLPNVVYFISGAVSYRMYRYIKTLSISKWYFGILLLVLLITILYSFFPIDIFFYTFKQYLYFLLIFVSTPLIFKLEKQITFNHFFGDLSYPIYISHLTILYFLNSFLPSSMKSPIVSILAVLIVSYILKKLIIDSVENYRQGRVKEWGKRVARQRKLLWNPQILYNKIFLRNK